ncbi:hypothetical protein CONLIGDRAFT_691254 [Coniochaeta ligniaria NRRL 30616]|uniref:VOC domain-containing protein n=1 Tax=Coniochaeta ligniaria NRRL 30616 TaxID=1408157 RepID=A0A1J7J6A4_9PEZI|nr:hypothetical protein CONLIGDRAFT_691254 [Coniochaeta ligniaria NRRL 30616]
MSEPNSRRDDSIDPIRSWSPPFEPLRPPVPYEPGAKLRILRHIPPKPFGGRYPLRDGGRLPVSLNMLRQTTVVDLCIANPPLEGTTLPEQSRELEVIELAAEDAFGAQLFVCSLDDGPETYVAKIYDPMYYEFRDPGADDLPRDVTYTADGDYSREAAAYEHIEATQRFCGTQVPKYCGSWTFDLPISLPTGTVTRPVRMILMEHIHGTTMLDFNFYNMSETKRLDVIARVIETHCRLLHVGLAHKEASQRNVMIVDSMEEQDMVERVCLIDFHSSMVYGIYEEVDQGRQLPELPPSPVDFWWDSGISMFGNWFADWDDIEEAWHHWLTERYGNSVEFGPSIWAADGQLRFGPWEDEDVQQDAELDGDDFHYSAVEKEQRLPAHSTAKRNRTDFEGDGSETPLELRNHKAMTPGNHGCSKGKEPERSKQNDQPLPSRSILGHISIGVKDYDSAKMFYSALRPLGLSLVYDSEAEGPSSGTRTLGYGPDKTQELLNIFEYGSEAHAPGRGSHVAFNAASRRAVDKFHEKALVYGGTCDGKPGIRSRYGPNYYAAFVISPDGWRLEAVCKNLE